ncbi:MAG: dihydroneopterin aldolase [Alphaproteobacteria bacterium]
MPSRASITLQQFKIKPDIGVYGADDIVPDYHLLDLTLSLSPRQLLIDEDSMAHVFDYDPLVTKIKELASQQHYMTQEYLLFRIVRCCFDEDDIKGVNAWLRKFPVDTTGQLGVRIDLCREDFESMFKPDEHR